MKAILTDDDLDAALKEISRLWGAKRGTPDGDRFEALGSLIEAYEKNHYPIGESLRRRKPAAFGGNKWACLPKRSDRPPCNRGTIVHFHSRNFAAPGNAACIGVLAQYDSDRLIGVARCCHVGFGHSHLRKTVTSGTVRHMSAGLGKYRRDIVVDVLSEAAKKAIWGS